MLCDCPLGGSSALQVEHGAGAYLKPPWQQIICLTYLRVYVHMREQILQQVLALHDFVMKGAQDGTMKIKKQIHWLLLYLQ